MDYIFDLWNWIDAGLILLYLPMAILDVLSYHNKTLMIIQVLYTFLIFMKLIYFLRISYQFSSLVTMMFRTFYEMQYFFIFYVIVMVGFAINLTILKHAEYLDYNYVLLAGYMLAVFRISVGDTEFDDFEYAIPTNL